MVKSCSHVRREIQESLAKEKHDPPVAIGYDANQGEVTKDCGVPKEVIQECVVIKECNNTDEGDSSEKYYASECCHVLDKCSCQSSPITKTDDFLTTYLEKMQLRQV